MYRVILVPLDGSSFSEHALHTAVSLARRGGAALRLVLVYPRLVRPLATPGAVPYDTQFDTDQLNDRARYMDAVVARVAAEGVPVSGTVVDDPDVAKAISAEARRSGADLIVLTTHGRGGVSRAWMGSTADELVRGSTHPLLLIRPASDVTPDAMAAQFAHVLIPLDGSELAEQVLPPALDFVALTGARITLLRVVKTPETLMPAEETFWTASEREFLERERLVAQQYLDEVAARLAAGDSPLAAPVGTVVTLAPEPARAILSWTGAHGADAVAICTNARGGLERMLVGSVTDKIVRGATMPTLVVRPTA